MIDHQHLDRPPAGLQTQAELLLQRGEEGRPVADGRRGVVARPRRLGVRQVSEFEIVGANEPGLVDDRAMSAIALGSNVEIYLDEKEKTPRHNTIRGLKVYLRRHSNPLHGIPA